jgi:hypothetical protein
VLYIISHTKPSNKGASSGNTTATTINTIVDMKKGEVETTTPVVALDNAASSDGDRLLGVTAVVLGIGDAGNAGEELVRAGAGAGLIVDEGAVGIRAKASSNRVLHCSKPAGSDSGDGDAAPNSGRTSEPIAFNFVANFSSTPFARSNSAHDRSSSALFCPAGLAAVGAGIDRRACCGGGARLS